MPDFDQLPLSSWAGAFLLGALVGGQAWGPEGFGLGGTLALVVPLAIGRATRRPVRA